MVLQLLPMYHDATTWMFIPLWSDMEYGVSYDLVGDIGLLVDNCSIVVLVLEVEEHRKNLVTGRLSMWLRWNSAPAQRFYFQGFLPRGCRNHLVGLRRMWVIETVRGRSVEPESMVFLRLVLPLLHLRGR